MKKFQEIWKTQEATFLSSSQIEKLQSKDDCIEWPLNHFHMSNLLAIKLCRHRRSHGGPGGHAPPNFSISSLFVFVKRRPKKILFLAWGQILCLPKNLFALKKFGVGYATVCQQLPYVQNITCSPQQYTKSKQRALQTFTKLFSLFQCIIKFFLYSTKAVLKDWVMSSNATSCSANCSISSLLHHHIYSEENI